jgi:hypothetical protein
MGLLRRRRNLEPGPFASTPPPDGAADCLDALSRRWGTEPVAGRFVDWATAAHYAGFGAGYCGVWHADDPLTPLDRFAIGPAGILSANLLLRRLELIPMLAARRLPGPRLIARADDVQLLLAEERVGEGFHVHAGVGDTAWFVHAFGVGPIPELPATEPGSAVLGDALERALADWGPVDWTAVPAAVPRGLFDTLKWAVTVNQVSGGRASIGVRAS